jgi:hypothetical protein
METQLSQKNSGAPSGKEPEAPNNNATSRECSLPST